MARRRSYRRCRFERLETRLPFAVAIDLAAIAGRVFVDTTGDGYTPGEEVAGAAVDLYRDNGNGQFDPAVDPVVRTLNTGPDGRYRFDGLVNGGYFAVQREQVLAIRTLETIVSELITISAADATGQISAMIDSFDTGPQLVFDDFNDGTPVTSSIQGSEIIGGERELLVDKTSVSGRIQLTANDPLLPGFLSFDSIQNGQGRKSILWNGSGSLGLGGIDLTDSGSAMGFRILIGADTSSGTVTVRVYSGLASVSSAVLTIPDTDGVAASLEYLPFSDFADMLGPGADFTNVSVIELEIAGGGAVNGAIDYFSTVSPTVRTADFSNLVGADLSLTMSASNTNPDVGENVTFTLSVRNDGPLDATGIVVQNFPLVQLGFVLASPSQGTYDSTGTSGFWTVGSLAVNGEATLTIVATPQLAATLRNTAEIFSSDQNDPDSIPANGIATEDDQATVTINVQNASLIDLSLTKTVDNLIPSPGSTVVLATTLINGGPSTATNIQVRDFLPGGLTLQSSNPSIGSYNVTTGIWTVPTLAAGGSVTLRLTAVVNASGDVTSTAEVLVVDQPDPDSTPGNNAPSEDDQASVTITVPSANLSLTIVPDNATPNVGDTVRFTITINNDGPNIATGVSAAAILPPGLTFVSATPSQGTFTSATGRWTVGSVNPATNATLDLFARVTTTGPKSVRAEVIESDQFDPNSTPGNNVEAEDDQQTVLINPQSVDLTLGMSVDRPRPLVGQNITFTLTVANEGSGTVGNVVINNRLPSGLTFVSAEPEQFYSPSEQVWFIGSLGPNEVVTLTFVAVYTQAQSVTHNVTVFSESSFDPPENNTASVTLTPAIAELGLNVSVVGNRPNLGDTVTIRTSVTNRGPDDAFNVVLEHSIPPGLAIIPSVPSTNSFLPGNQILTFRLSDLAPGDTETFDITLRVDSMFSQMITTTVRSDSSDSQETSLLIDPQRIDLQLSHSTDVIRPNVGQIISLRTALSNVGPDVATGVQVMNRLPSGLIFVSAAASIGSYDSATGLWDIDALAVDQTAVMTIQALVDDNVAMTSITEVVRADQADIDSRPSNRNPTEDDLASVTITPQQVDLSLTMAIDRELLFVGEFAELRITLTNDGADSATGILIGGELLPDMDWVLQSAADGSFNASTGLWQIPILQPNSSATLILKVRFVKSGDFTYSVALDSVDQIDASIFSQKFRVIPNIQAEIFLRIIAVPVPQPPPPTVDDPIEPPVNRTPEVNETSDIYSVAMMIPAAVDQRFAVFETDLQVADASVVPPRPQSADRIDLPSPSNQSVLEAEAVNKALLDTIDIGSIPSLVVPTVTDVAIDRGYQTEPLIAPAEILFEANTNERPIVEESTIATVGLSSENAATDAASDRILWLSGAAAVAASGTAIAMSPVVRNRLRKYTGNRLRTSLSIARLIDREPS